MFRDIHLPKNIYESKTVDPTLRQFEGLHDYLFQELVADRGCRGESQVKDEKLSILKPSAKKLLAYQQTKHRKKFRKHRLSLCQLSLPVI